MKPIYQQQADLREAIFYFSLSTWYLGSHLLFCRIERLFLHCSCFYSWWGFVSFTVGEKE